MNTEMELHLLEFSHSMHESWLDCYRIALEYGPTAAGKIIETLDNTPLTPRVCPITY